MQPVMFASVFGLPLASLAFRAPVRCPYCPEIHRKHWVKWGGYWRFADGSKERIRVQCYHCPIAKRWFSLLPDGLLPYRYLKVSRTLQLLNELVIQKEPLLRMEKKHSISRTVLRRLKQAFRKMVSILRLPDREGVHSPVTFLQGLAAQGEHWVREQFAAWKENEPKLSLLGVYPR